ncbi:MAG: glycosyltransferase family 2 protein [Nitrosomonas sp.]|nr:glycosyltransferase family 2 protein [Nitrosomonas sp.]MBY0579307.1 glycosyltransferase family 2 protein [Burkholderiales bacterium]
MTAILSICIPTYNRSKCLGECLSSIFASVVGHESEVEIIISDNASTDDTQNVIRAFHEMHPWIRCHRNEQNIGAERNFYLLATLAQGENIWIFGDDDKMEASAIPIVLDNIRAGYGLTICNYSLWDSRFVVQKKKFGLPGKRDQAFVDMNDLMKCFGLHLGYISAVIIKRSLFFKLPPDEYESLVEYGFSFLYAVYTGVVKGACKVSYIVEPLICNRGGNSGGYDWYKYFVTGSSLVFDRSLSNGYTQSAVLAAKHQVLRDFVIPNFVSMRLLENGSERKKVTGLLFRHYNKNWLFWVVCAPVLIVPSFVLHLAKKIRMVTRR